MIKEAHEAKIITEEIYDIVINKQLNAIEKGTWRNASDCFMKDCFFAAKLDVDSSEIIYSSFENFISNFQKTSLEIKRKFDVTAIRNFFRSSIKINTISVKNDTAIVKRTTTGNICTKQNEKFFVEDTTFFICKYTQDRWKISHYFQYIDNSKNCGKFLPPNTNQHITAGPYSPVLEVVPGSIVVISGQVAVDENGNTIGNTIEEQAAYTLENCKVQLKTADCTFSDVFKVNVFLDDLGMWERFNTVYEQTLPDPKPVRTAIQAKLLSDYIVEIELWAVKTKSNDITIQQQSFII